MWLLLKQNGIKFHVFSLYTLLYIDQSFNVVVHWTYIVNIIIYCANCLYSCLLKGFLIFSFCVCVWGGGGAAVIGNKDLVSK